MLEISELFASLQGEGPSTGTPAFFVRLARCNLRCRWCDTGYAWDFGRHRYEDAVKVLSVSEVREAFRGGRQPALVVTGGEPLLQQDGLVALLSGIDPAVTVEVETNGSLVPSPELCGRVDQWNVSPKLTSSGVPEAARLRPDALLALRETGRAWLKIVVLDDSERSEASALITRTGWPRQRVCLMPRAMTREELRDRSPAVAALCVKLGLRFSSRLQLELWDGQRNR